MMALKKLQFSQGNHERPIWSQFLPTNRKFLPLRMLLMYHTEPLALYDFGM